MAATSARWRLGKGLRRWQQEALEAWKAAGDRGIAAVVTGGGKTFLAYACILDVVERRPDACVVVLVPTVALLDQWLVGLTDDLGVASDDIGLFGGGQRAAQHQTVNLMVINTGRTVAPELAAEHPTMLVVDECHRSASPMNALALAGEHVATLGLSATPERDFDDLFGDVVEPALGPIIYTYDYRQARAEGVVSPFNLSNVRVPLGEEEQRRYDALTRKLAPLMRQRDRGEQVDDAVERLLRDRARVSTGAHARLPTAVRLVERHRGERAIVFHEQIDAAEVIVASLAHRKHRVAAYHSGLGTTHRQDNLRLFRRGEIDVLVTCRALDEGINVPDASVAVIAASTAGTRQRIQRLGRVLRPAPGKERAVVYTIYASEPEGERLRLEEERLEGTESVRWFNSSGP
ncbi:MAG TPA: DEAD/DEAH box helicase [Acidimicrobiales bacterium]|nr:DEAD/DEAH box helicase [Acidimicrobiales bacterium]